MAYTEIVPVLRGHLEELYRALDHAYGYHSADDLARQYKSMTTRYAPSNLTKSLGTQLEHVRGYLEIEEEDQSVGVPEE